MRVKSNSISLNIMSNFCVSVQINLASLFLGSGKNDLQNHFFLLYYPKQGFLMSSREVTKTQKYTKFFKRQ